MADSSTRWLREMFEFVLIGRDCVTAEDLDEVKGMSSKNPHMTPVSLGEFRCRHKEGKLPLNLKGTVEKDVMLEFVSLRFPQGRFSVMWYWFSIHTSCCLQAGGRCSSKWVQNSLKGWIKVNKDVGGPAEALTRANTTAGQTWQKKSHQARLGSRPGVITYSMVFLLVRLAHGRNTKMGGCKLEEDRTALQVMWSAFSDLLWETQDQTNTTVWVLHEEYKIDGRDIVQGGGLFVEVSVRSRDKMVTIDEMINLATGSGDEDNINYADKLRKIVTSNGFVPLQVLVPILVNNDSHLTKSILYQIAYLLSWPLDFKLWMQSWLPPEKMSLVKHALPMQLVSWRDLKVWQRCRAIYQYMAAAKKFFSGNSVAWCAVDGVRCAGRSLFVSTWGDCTNHCVWCAPKVPTSDPFGLHLRCQMGFI